MFSPNLKQKEKVSVDNFRDLYNPTDNTINLAKLSVALRLGDLPHRDSSVQPSLRSLPDDDSDLASILSLTLQKLKRRPSKAPAKLKPLDQKQSSK
jgi:hypothetical protein